jgi:CRP-like cAMP-binding protein
VYIVLFGTLALCVKDKTRHILGVVNVGWTLGEEVLFSDEKRPETVFA